VGLDEVVAALLRAQVLLLGTAWRLLAAVPSVAAVCCRYAGLQSGMVSLAQVAACCVMRLNY
jgi:hypothetical protein